VNWTELAKDIWKMISANTILGGGGAKWGEENLLKSMILKIENEMKAKY
jgi:hypothetical protein